MKISKLLSKLSFLAVALIAVVAFVLSTQANAIPYNGKDTPPSPVPAFNVYTGVDKGVGDEPDFFRGRVGESGTFVDPLNNSCAPGTEFQLRVYVHNGASEDKNNGGSGPSVAHNTKVAINLNNANQASKFVPSAQISASNAATVTDDMTLNCNGNTVKMSYITGSASQFSVGTGTIPVSDSIVTPAGAPIRSQSVAGDVWGCWDDRVYVVIKVKVEKPVKPVTPVYSCDALSVLNLGDRKFRYTLSYTAKNGATLKNVTYDFGDGNSEGPTTETTVDHTYAKDGTFTTKATLVFAVKDSKDVVVNGENCKVTVKSETPKEYCPIPGKEHLPANSPDCKEVPEQPPVTPPTTPPVTVMPATGAGSAFAGLFGSSALGYGAYSFLQKRRALKK